MNFLRILNHFVLSFQYINLLKLNLLLLFLFPRYVFKIYEHGVNKPQGQLELRKYYQLKKKENLTIQTENTCERLTHFSQNLMSTSQYFVRTSSRRFPTRSDSTEDFILAATENRSPSSRGSSPSIAYRRQVALPI
jgi:hypothetical protein